MAIGALVSVVGGTIVAFTGSWKITLVMLAFMPMLFIGGKLTSRLTFEIDKNAKHGKTTTSAGQVCHILTSP